MSRKIVAIAGGENGRLLDNGEYEPYETEAIDREIVELTGKDKPNFLFLAHSHAKSLEVQEGYYQTMEKIYGNLFGCYCRDLKSNELDDLDKVKEMLEWADIIYEGGGDTLSMIELWKRTGFDNALYEAWLKGKVICGVSAGAVCWFKSCNSDSLIIQGGNESIGFTSVDCLNWINAHFTPHCDAEGRYESTRQQLKENDLVGIMMSNCAALEIIDDEYRMIVSDEKAYGLRAYWENDVYLEEKLEVSNNFKPLKKLLSKNIKK